MQDQYFDDIQTWYVVFSPRRTRRCRLSHFFVSRHFNHVFLLRETLDGKTLVIDPLKWGTAVQLLDEPIEKAIVSAARVNTAVVGYTVDYRRIFKATPRGFYTCVTLCKAILGMKGLTLTPFGLYRKILKQPTVNIVKPYVPYVHNTPSQ